MDAIRAEAKAIHHDIEILAFDEPVEAQFVEERGDDRRWTRSVGENCDVLNAARFLRWHSIGPSSGCTAKTNHTEKIASMTGPRLRRTS